MEEKTIMGGSLKRPGARSPWRNRLAVVAIAGYCAIIGTLVVIEPLFALAISGASVLLPLVIAYPRAAALVSVTAGLFASSMAQFIHAGLGVADEAAVAVLLVAALSARLSPSTAPRGTTPGIRAFLVFFLLAGLSSIAASVPPSTALAGALLASKGAACFWSVAQFRIGARELTVIWRYVACISWFLIAGALLNLAAPSAWSSLSGIPISQRGGSVSLHGFLLHPLTLGNMSAVLAIAALAHWIYIRRSSATLALFLLLSFVCIGSLRRTAILGLAVGLLYLAHRVNRSRTWLSIATTLPVAAWVLIDPLRRLVSWTATAYVGDADAARTLLTRDAFYVAWSEFPFGAGFGRFGSYIAGVDYSPVYVELGYDTVWGLSAKTGNDSFLYDTQWPAIIGEAGFLGAIAFVAFLVQAWRSGRVTSPVGQPMTEWMYVTTTGALMVLVLASAAVPVFVAAPFNLALFSFLGLAYAVKSSSRHTLAVSPPTQA